jgi:tetratricopeptide (TPR) repeat protein
MQPALHRVIVVVDVTRFGDRRRTNEHQVVVRDGLYVALRRSWENIGVPWARCRHEDRGDGVFILAPADIPKAVFVEKLPRELATALRAHNAERGAEEQIRLRLAIHAGEVRYDDNGVTGAAINLAFRLLDAPDLKSAAHGSTAELAVVVSSWFYDEVVRHSAASEPSSYQPIRVNVKETDTTAWIRVPGTSARAGQADARRTLPRDKAAFTGRRDELAQLLASATASLEADRVMAVHTIDGMAGVGKTALAVHLAHLLAGHFPDGQLFVPLHAHTPGQRPADPAEVLHTLLISAGVASTRIPADLDARAAMWRDHLVGRKVLLVLDDAAGHQQVEPLLPASAGCLVLVTSRQRLTALDAAVTFPLDTLPPDDAVVMFTRLSGRPADGKGAEQVAEIVRLAGYLPLAISLVAGRLRHRGTWTVADLAADLSSTRGRLLQIRAEDVAVAAAFDLSYRTLPANERQFFCCLGLHPGPELDVYAAAALAGVPTGEASAHLDALYNDHLLDESAPGRYRMHDLVRDYAHIRAQQDLADGGRDAVTRLMAHYQRNARIAEDRIYGKVMTGGHAAPAADTIVDVSTALAWLQAERANLAACVEYAAHRGENQQLIELQDALTSFLWVTGPWDQGIPRQQHPADGRHDDLPGQAYALSRHGHDLMTTGDFTGAIEAFTRAVAIYRDLDLRELRKRMANTLSFLGIAQLVIGDVRGAIEAQEQALEIFSGLDYPLGEAYVLNELGVAYRTTGDLDKAADVHARALAILRAVGSERGEAFALHGLGAVRRLAGDTREAITIQRKALEIYRAVGSRTGEADALDELGAAIGATGDFAGAEHLHRQAIQLYRDLGHLLGQAETHNNRGVLLRAAGEPRRAVEEHRSALRFATGVRSPLEKARALEGMASCELDLGADDDARSHLHEAIAIYGEIGAETAVARTARRLAQL